MEQSIVLSSYDELLGDIDKVEMREVYEELHKGYGKGKTPYLMTEPYLFALKRELERRQYPTRNLYINPHSPKEILSRISEENLQTDVFALIDEFINSINDYVLLQQGAREEEKERFQEISDFLKKWKRYYPEKIQELETRLSDESLLEEFYEILHEFEKQFEYTIDEKLIKNKLIKKYLGTDKQLLCDELKKAIKTSIYSVEQYNLENFESALLEDREFIEKSASFRYQISQRLYQILRDLEADPLLFVSLRNSGIHE